MKLFFCFFFSSLFVMAAAQHEDRIYQPNIHTVKLFKAGDQLSFPVLNLGSIDRLELHFDDLDRSIKQYYYAFQLCNADWTPSILSPFDYIRCFQNVRISSYRSSSLAITN